MKFREVVRLPEFERDIRKLVRRFTTLEDDLEVFLHTAAFAYHKLNHDTGIVAIPGLGQTTLPIYKACCDPAFPGHRVLSFFLCFSSAAPPAS